MESIVAYVRRKVPRECFADKCEKEDCSLRLDNVPASRVLIDLDMPGNHVNLHATRCDFLFIGEQGSGSWVAPLELTGGKADASKFARQLQAGANIAHRIIPTDAAVQLRPLAVHGRELRPNEIRKLVKHRVSFRGKRFNIVRKRCGAALAEALR